MEARIRTGYMQLIFYSAFSLSRFQQVARLDAGQIRHTSRIGTTFSVCVSCKRSPCLDLKKRRETVCTHTPPVSSSLEFWRARNTSPRTPQMISTCAQVKISCQRANSRLLASGGTARVLEGLDICQLTSRL